MNKINQIIKTLESKYKWMKITKEKSLYTIEDTRFQPYSVMNWGLTESEFLEEVRLYLI
jgi:hypothetical protein